MKYYKEEILALLQKRGIDYQAIEHEAVYTMDEMKDQGILERGRVCKNLFLRDQKGKEHILVSMPDDKQVSLKDLGQVLGVGKLSFASEERLQKYLAVTHGAVSPLGVLNDETHTVIVALDEELMSWEKIGVHPNDNTATVWVKPTDLKAIIDSTTNTCKVLKI